MQNIFYVLVISLALNISSDDSNNINRVITYDGCSTKLKQILKPEYPLTDHQGYSVITFTIDNDGLIQNTKLKESMCVTKRNEQGMLKFRRCPFFINKTLIASRYLRYIPPKDADGKSCTIENHDHRFNFKLYTIDEDANDFLLRNEFIDKIEKLNDKK